MDRITSPANPLLKEIRRVLARGELSADGCIAAETFHLLDEALRSGCQITTVLAAESALAGVEDRMGGRNGVRLTVLPDVLFEKISSTETSQGVLALVRPPAWTVDDLFRGCSLVVVLDAVQDPGNAGAIVRSAEAFGATGVMFLKGTVSPYNSKTLRASAGSLFRVPYVHGMDAATACAAFTARRIDVYATSPSGEIMLQGADLQRRCAMVIGSEAHGVSEALRSIAIDLRIPTTGVESLNAAAAAAVLLYEASRQRRSAA